jgi:alginate O-acetyltransferase complex protein AlgI
VGLWGWGFVTWGLLHGFYMACSVFYRPYQKRIHKSLKLDKTIGLKIWQIFVTFNLVCLAFIFFRANGGHEALYVLHNMLNFVANYSFIESNGFREFVKKYVFLGEGRYEIIIIGTSLFIYYVFTKIKLQNLLKKPAYIRWPCYYFLLVTIVMFMTISKSYIYLQF